MSARRVAALTIASRSCLALARVTARSFRQHNPGMDFVLLLADTDEALEPTREPFSRILRLPDLPISDLPELCFRCSEMELSYALTPLAIDFLLGDGFDGVIFLKQETLVLGELGSLAVALDRHSVLLTPHFLEPPDRPDALEWELNVLRAGIFNCGVVAFSRCSESRSFLGWWWSKTSRDCTRNIPEGMHFEQRWLDFAPSLMPGYQILRDPGLNVAHWNLADRQLRVEAGRVEARGRPCRVFRFSGYDSERPESVTRYHSRYPVRGTGDAAQVFALYHSMLMEAGHEETRRSRYGYAHFDNGTAVTDEARRTYRELGERARRFGNPFESTPPGSYYRWLETGSGGRA